MVRFTTNFQAGRVISVGLSGLRLSSGAGAVAPFDVLSFFPMVVPRAGQSPVVRPESGSVGPGGFGCGPPYPPVVGGCSIPVVGLDGDRKSTRLNSSHVRISYAVFCL